MELVLLENMELASVAQEFFYCFKSLKIHSDKNKPLKLASNLKCEKKYLK